MEASEMSIEREIDKEDVVHIYYTMECFSAIKQNEIVPSAATWMDLEIVILSEISQTEKEKCDITYMWDLKRNDRNELIYKTETGSQT